MSEREKVDTAHVCIYIWLAVLTLIILLIFENPGILFLKFKK